MFQFDYPGAFGQTITVALARTTYFSGNTALMMVHADTSDELFGELFGMLSVNIPDDPGAREWADVDAGNFILDTNNNGEDAVRAILDAGIVELAPGYASSGFCTYPYATLTDIAGVPSYDELMRALRGAA